MFEGEDEVDGDVGGVEAGCPGIVGHVDVPGDFEGFEVEVFALVLIIGRAAIGRRPYRWVGWAGGARDCCSWGGWIEAGGCRTFPHWRRIAE